MKFPLLYEKLRGTIDTRIEWTHPELRQALSPYRVTKQDYQQILHELKGYHIIKIKPNCVISLGNSKN